MITDPNHIVIIARMRLHPGEYEAAKIAAIRANMSTAGWVGEAVSEKLARDAEKEES